MQIEAQKGGVLLCSCAEGASEVWDPRPLTSDPEFFLLHYSVVK